MSVPTVGPDGAVYFGQSLSYLQAVSGDFIPKWTFFDGSILSYPVVSPANDIVFTGGAPNYGVPGFVRAFSTSSGQLLWSLDLGVENGGNQNMQSIPRFTPDGSTVYFGTVILGGTGSPFCFLYAVDATSSGGGIPCEDLLSFQARCQSNGSAHRLQAKLTLTDTSHSGEQVIITVDGHLFTVTINGNQAQLSLNNPALGQHTIVLTDPAGCFPPRMPSCQ